MKIYVVSPKGEELVGEAEGLLAGKVVFDEYTREKAVLRGETWEGLPARFLELEGAADLAGFKAYLAERGKAALARVDEGRCALLPDGRLVLYARPAKKQRIETPNDRDALVDALPEWSKRREAPSDAMVFRDGDDAGVYFQDARRRYEFRCGRPGLRLLVALQRASRKTLELLDAELAVLEPAERARLLDEGKSIYAEKPSLRNSSGAGKYVTWSNDEYAHAGLRAQYLRLKSLQRFTETFNLLHRAHAADETAKGVLEQPVIRAASLGGGPAFELVALDEFSRQRKEGDGPSKKKLHLYSLDLQPAWRQYAQALGCKFRAPFDVHEATPDSVIEACDATPLDVLVVSYLLIYCTTDRTADLFANLLKQNHVKILIISERTRDQGIVPLLRARGLHVLPLLDQTREPDFRQLLVLRPADRKKNRSSSSSSSSSQDHPLQLLFPNVPFARGT